MTDTDLFCKVVQDVVDGFGEKYKNLQLGRIVKEAEAYLKLKRLRHTLSLITLGRVIERSRTISCSFFSSF